MAAKIETVRLFMCRPLDQDILSLKNLWRNEKVREFLGGTVSDDFIHQRIAALQNHWDLHQFGLWTVFEKNTHQIRGLCGLQYSEDGTEISYMFFPDFWRRGIAREALIAILNYGFKKLQLETIIAITQKENTVSCPLLHKIGMNHINNFMRFNAIQYLYKLTQKDWCMKSD